MLLVFRDDYYSTFPNTCEGTNPIGEKLTCDGGNWEERKRRGHYINAIG